MSKPNSFWSWESLKSWMVGRHRKPRATRRMRTMRMESLNPRIVLAADGIVGHETALPAEEAAVEGAIATDAVAGVELVVGELSSQQVDAFIDGGAQESPDSRETDSNSSPNEGQLILAEFDVNLDQHVSALDVLVLANALQNSEPSDAITLEQLDRLDVNGDGVIS